MNDALDPQTVDLVYVEVRDLLRRQEAKLKEARTRAGTVLAVAAFALSFLGGSILDTEGQPEPGAWFWLGAVLIVGSMLLCLWVLIPPRRATLLFSPEPRTLIDSYLPLSSAEARKHLSGYMASWIEENQPEIDPLFTGLRWGTIALGVGVVLLLAKLAGVV